MPLHVSSTMCSSSGGQIVLNSIWYHHTETSEWSKITKIQFHTYEHIVVKFMYEFLGVITAYYLLHITYCILLTAYYLL